MNITNYNQYKGEKHYINWSKSKSLNHRIPFDRAEDKKIYEKNT